MREWNDLTDDEKRELVNRAEISLKVYTEIKWLVDDIADLYAKPAMSWNGNDTKKYFNCWQLYKSYACKKFGCDEKTVINEIFCDIEAAVIRDCVYTNNFYESYIQWYVRRRVEVRGNSFLMDAALDWEAIQIRAAKWRKIAKELSEEYEESDLWDRALGETVRI